MVMWNKEVQVIFKLIKRENLIVLAIDKCEKIAKIGPVSLHFVPASSFMGAVLHIAFLQYAW